MKDISLVKWTHDHGKSAEDEIRQQQIGKGLEAERRIAEGLDVNGHTEGNHN